MLLSSSTPLTPELHSLTLLARRRRARRTTTTTSAAPPAEYAWRCRFEPSPLAHAALVAVYLRPRLSFPLPRLVHHSHVNGVLVVHRCPPPVPRRRPRRRWRGGNRTGAGAGKPARPRHAAPRPRLDPSARPLRLVLTPLAPLPCCTGVRTRRASAAADLNLRWRAAAARTARPARTEPAPSCRATRPP